MWSTRSFPLPPPPLRTRARSLVPRLPGPHACAPRLCAARGDVDEGFSDEQMHELATAEEDVDERMREIQRIAKSVEDLAVLFKELATLVVEQGTILDRIDHNMEQAVEATQKGVVELVDAEKFQCVAGATVLRGCGHSPVAAVAARHHHHHHARAGPARVQRVGGSNCARAPPHSPSPPSLLSSCRAESRRGPSSA